MPNERRDDDQQTEPSASEQVKKDAEMNRAPKEDRDDAKEDVVMDDRFQATDN